jgi:hypothetical protein
MWVHIVATCLTNQCIQDTLRLNFYRDPISCVCCNQVLLAGYAPSRMTLVHILNVSVSDLSDIQYHRVTVDDIPRYVAAVGQQKAHLGGARHYRRSFVIDVPVNSELPPALIPRCLSDSKAVKHP